MSAHPVELHSTKHVLELANGSPLSGGADTFDLDILCATAPAGPGGASDPSNDIQTALGPDAPEPNKFCVMHPDPTCSTRFKLCDECTRYMYSDAALLQRRQLTACLATTDRSRAIESNPSAHNPHRLDKFHLPRGANAGLCEIRDYDEARVRAFALKKIIDRGKRDMNYLVAHYKHVEKETAYLERWCERNKVGDLTEEQVNLIWESIGREPPRLPPLDTPGPSSNGPGPEAANRNAASGPSVQLGTPTIPPAAAQLDPAATAAAHNPGNRDANNNNDTNANGSSGSRLKERQKPKATNWKKGRSMQNRKSEEAHSSSGQSRSSAPRTMSSVSRSGTDSKGSRAGSALVNLPSTPQTTLIPCDAVSERCLMASPRDDRPPDIVGIAPSDTDGILYVADAQNAQVKLFDLKNRGVSVAYQVENLHRIAGFGRVESTSSRAMFLMATTSSDPLQPYEALLLRETRSPVDAADPTAVSSLRAAAGSPDAMPRRRLAAAASGGGADLHSKQVQHELRVVDRVRIERRREHDKALDLCECRGVTACVATLDKDRAALAFVGQPVMHELWFNRCVEPDETRTAATSRATNSNANEQNSARAADGCSCNTAPVDDEVSVNANGEDSQGKNSSDTGIKSKQTRGASTAAANEQKESLILVSDHDLPALVRGLCTGLGGLLAVALSDETIRVFSRSTIYAVTNEEGTRHDPTDPNKESLSELTCLFPLGGPSSPFHAVALVATEDKRGIFVLTRHERGIRTGGPYNLDAATSIDLLEIRESNALRLANSDSANDTDSTKKLQARAKTKEELVEDLDVPTFTLPRRLLYAERALELQAAMLLPRAGRYGADLVAAFDGKTRSLRFFQIV